jgi:beta-glucanase (GH16 family)
MSSGKNITSFLCGGLHSGRAIAAGLVPIFLCLSAWIFGGEVSAEKTVPPTFAMAAGGAPRISPCNWTLPDFGKTDSERSGRAELPLSDQENRAKWVLDSSLSDEFNGAALDLSRWLPGIDGWAGRPPALFVPENISEGNGKLSLRMAHQSVPAKFLKAGYRDYTTAAVQSRKPVLYGYFEIRAKIMPSAGSSAFWLAAETPQNWNEIDVFEMAGRAPGDPHKVFMDAHVFRSNGRTANMSLPGVMATAENMSDEFHVYGLDWSASSIEVYVDGRRVRHICNTSWHMPLKIILDAETQGKWWGLPSFRDLPSTFQVDYIRVWRHRTAGM